MAEVLVRRGSFPLKGELIVATSVDLVRAYLHVNGDFTVTEYPVLERLQRGEHRMMTDLDLLALRLSGAGPIVSGLGPKPGVVLALQEPDPFLGRRRGESDMIVAEVKDGYAELNRAASNPRVIEAALVRFGCCAPEEVARAVSKLIEQGEVETGHGHRIRLCAFGSTVPQGATSAYTAIPLGHVASFLRAHLRENWDIVRNAQISDPALGFLSLLEKAERGDPR